MSGFEGGRFDRPLYKYKGKDYHIVRGGHSVVELTDPKRVPDTLSRVAVKPLVFDENDILSPQNPTVTNDMVSMAHPDEWEKFARMFHFGVPFQTLTIDSSQLVGPLFITGNRILLQNETLGLVPRSAIQEVAIYTWGRAEQDYDYKESDYPDTHDRDFYQRLVLNKKRGLKPIKVGSI